MVEAFGPDAAIADARERAWQRFATVLEELVAELPLLRRPVEEATGVRGAVAKRMVAACFPYRSVFITPMAAVAGAVADEVLAAMMKGRPGITKAYVNNGGRYSFVDGDGDATGDSVDCAPGDPTAYAVPTVGGLMIGADRITLTWTSWWWCTGRTASASATRSVSTRSKRRTLSAATLGCSRRRRPGSA